MAGESPFPEGTSGKVTRTGLQILALGLGLLCVEAAEARAPCAAREGWNAHVHSHRDLGFRRVGWTWSWSAEGVADDLHVMDCQSGEGLAVRARAERMTNPIAYDKRKGASALIAQQANAPHFFRLDTLADALARQRLPAERFTALAEPCACAAFYPGVFPGKNDAGVALGRHDMRDP